MVGGDGGKGQGIGGGGGTRGVSRGLTKMCADTIGTRSTRAIISHHGSSGSVSCEPCRGSASRYEATKCMHEDSSEANAEVLSAAARGAGEGVGGAMGWGGGGGVGQGVGEGG